ncbi:hypothetical protein [Nonlabens xiamenensis]|uniref:hypothetical protein n=1 Tax=Nonlabens xiamenensis TaxID=2341043 RepID=UPI000F6154C2|nr:hypothetical protein [Nonlabens xiamenensis]
MKNLRLEQSFSGHQIVMISCGILAFAAITFNKLTANGWNWTSLVMALPFFLITVALVGVLFLQNGFTARSNNRIARSWFWFGIPIRMKTINADKYPVISVLRMGKKQKLAWTVAANPDLSVSYSSYDITSLNEKHTKKERLIILKNQRNAENAIAFILNHSNLREEIYSPDFS